MLFETSEFRCFFSGFLFQRLVVAVMDFKKRAGKSSAAGEGKTFLESKQFEETI